MSIHSSLTDSEGIHRPKGFDSAPSPGYAYKNSSGDYTWEEGKPLVEEKVGVCVYLDTPEDIVFTASDWQDSGLTFTYKNLAGFTTDGISYSGLIYDHPEDHCMMVSVSTSISSDTSSNTVKVGYGVNSDTTPEPGTENGTFIKNTDELYNISATFTLEGVTGNEYTLLFYSSKAATLTVQDCQITAIKMYQEN